MITSSFISGSMFASSSSWRTFSCPQSAAMWRAVFPFCMCGWVGIPVNVCIHMRTCMYVQWRVSAEQVNMKPTIHNVLWVSSSSTWITYYTRMGKIFIAGLHSSSDGNRLSRCFPPPLISLDLSQQLLSAQVKFVVRRTLCPDLNLCRNMIILDVTPLCLWTQNSI